MAKVRVYEYAKAIDVSSKDIIAALKDMNVEVNNHMATLEDDTVKKLDAIYKKAKAKETANEKPAEQKKQSSNKNNDRKKNDVQNNQFNKNKKNNNQNKNKNKRGGNNKPQHQQARPVKPKKSFLKN